MTFPYDDQGEQLPDGWHRWPTRLYPVQYHHEAARKFVAPYGERWGYGTLGRSMFEGNCATREEAMEEAASL